MFFKELIEMLNTRPMVPGKTAACLRLWESLNEQQQQHIYHTIRNKLQAGKFVHYDPVKAVQENIPRVRTLVITADEYYRQYGTQTAQNGWVRKHIPEEQRTVYVKQSS